jgi:hypothetical protein
MAISSETENKIDSQSLHDYLEPSERPQGVPPDAIDESIRQMARRAHRRLVMNQTGGLPGPELHRRSVSRLLVDVFTRKRRSHR